MNELQWQKLNFKLRIIIIILLILLGGLIYWRGLSPCEKCKINVPVHGEVSCLELVYNWSLQCYPPINKSYSNPKINFSLPI